MDCTAGCCWGLYLVMASWSKTSRATTGPGDNILAGPVWGENFWISSFNIAHSGILYISERRWDPQTRNLPPLPPPLDGHSRGLVARKIEGGAIAIAAVNFSLSENVFLAKKFYCKNTGFGLEVSHLVAEGVKLKVWEPLISLSKICTGLSEKNATFCFSQLFLTNEAAAFECV